MESGWRWSFDWKRASVGLEALPNPHAQCSSSIKQRWLSMPWCLWSARVTHSPHCYSTLVSLHLSCTPSVKYICCCCHILPNMCTGPLWIYGHPEISCLPRSNSKTTRSLLRVTVGNVLHWRGRGTFHYLCLFTWISHPLLPGGIFKTKYCMYEHCAVFASAHLMKFGILKFCFPCIQCVVVVAVNCNLKLASSTV